MESVLPPRPSEADAQANGRRAPARHDTTTEREWSSDAAPPQHLVENDGPGDCRVQRRDVAPHRKADQEITGRPHQPPEAPPFRTHHQYQGNVYCELIVTERSPRIQTNDPVSLSFEFLQCPREVRDPRD